MAQPGRYPKYVTLAKAPDETPDSDGFFEALSPPGWWCALQPLEPGTADSTRVTPYRVEGRYRSDITVEVRLRYGTRELYVKGTQDVDEGHHTLVLYCEEVR